MFNILKFNDIPDPNLRDCLGILSYNLKYRRNIYDIAFIPTKFIQPLSSKAKTNLIEYLISNGYIRRIERHLTIEEKNRLNLIRPSYMKLPYFYQSTQKLLALDEYILNNESVEKTLIINLHHLNNQAFNHFAHNIRYIHINLPNEGELRQLLNEYQYMHTRPLSFYVSNVQVEAMKWGNLNYKEYNINEIYFEDKNGTPNHLLTKYPVLRKYTSLQDAIEIGIRSSEALLLADQLYKTFGKNELFEFFKYSQPGLKIIYKIVKSIYEIKRGNKKRIDEDIRYYKSTRLFESESDYYFDQQMEREHFIEVVSGFRYNEEFAIKYPKTWNILYHIKKGHKFIKKRGSASISKDYFKKFVSTFIPPKPMIFKNDIRLKADDVVAIKNNQSYYKVINLVIQLREIEIMRKIWSELKKREILFVPLYDKVLISNNNIKAVEYIIENVWRKYIHKDLQINLDTKKYF